MMKVCEDCKYAEYNNQKQKLYCYAYEADVTNLLGGVCPRFEIYESKLK